MRFNSFIMILIGLCIINACGMKNETVPAPSGEEVVISFDDIDVTVQDTMLAFQESMNFQRLMAPSPVEEASKALSSLSHLTGFQKYLSDLARKEGLDQQDAFIEYKKNIIEEELAQKLIVEEVLSQINITEDDIKQFYNENKESLFLMKDSNYYEVRGIYTIKDKHKAGEAEKLIHDAHDKLEQNLRFESVAKDYSDAPSYMRGEVNRFSPNNFSFEALRALEQLEDGEYSDVMDWEDRYMILKRENYVPPEYLDIKDSRQLILTQLTQQQTERKMFQLMEGLKQKYSVFMNEDLIMQENVEDPSVIVASIADVEEITYQEFQEFVAQKNLNTDEAKKEYLNQLVFQNLCLTEAYSRGWAEEDVSRPVNYWCERELSKNYILESLGKVSREKLESLYEENKSEKALKTPKYVDYSYLLFRVPNLMQATRYEQRLYYQTAYSKARQALQDLESGKSFGEVIALYETSDSGAVIGERVGRISMKELSPAVQNMIKDLKVGQTSEPQKISNVSKNRFGYEIFHIHSIEEPKPLPKEQALHVIAQQLAQQKYLEKQEALQKEFFENTTRKFNKSVFQKMIDYLVYLHNHADQQVEIAQYLYGDFNS